VRLWKLLGVCGRPLGALSMKFVFGIAIAGDTHTMVRLFEAIKRIPS